MRHEFSPKSFAVLRSAAEIARETRHEEIQPAHLLLALFDDKEGGVSELLRHVSGDGENGSSAEKRLLAALQKRLPPGTALPARGKLPLSPAAQRAVQLADEEAARCGSDAIEPVHLLVGLSCEEKGETGRLLRQHGFDPQTLRALIDDQFPTRDAPGDGSGRLKETINGRREGVVETLIDVETGISYRQHADDARLYVPRHEDFLVKIKHGWGKEYCFFKNPGEEYFHLLLSGEIYLQRGEEKYCLNCAVRHGILTRNRLYWQRGKQKNRSV